MPVTGTRLTTGQVGTTAATTGAPDPAALGALVLEALKNQPAGTMSVPKEVLEQLATAVVQLANEVAALQGAGAVTATPGGPTIDAQLTITSTFSAPKQREHLDGLASKIRVKCAELGIKLDVKVASVYAISWQLEVAGKAPKAALDELRTFINGEVRGIGLTEFAKVQVGKYDVV